MEYLEKTLKLTDSSFIRAQALLFFFPFIPKQPELLSPAKHTKIGW